MPKRSIFLLVALALILAACGGQATQAPTQAPSEVPTVAATEPLAQAGTAGPTEPVPDCTVTTFIPEPDPTLAAIFPAPGADDHVLGAADADVTFIEYSDFQ